MRRTLLRLALIAALLLFARPALATCALTERAIFEVPSVLIAAPAPEVGGSCDADHCVYSLGAAVAPPAAPGDWLLAAVLTAELLALAMVGLMLERELPLRAAPASSRLEATKAHS